MCRAWLARLGHSRRRRLAPDGDKLAVPDNITLLPLPPYAPELNPVENIWLFLRQNFLSHRIWNSYEEIVDACCAAWNALMAMPERIVSIASRDWAKVG